MKRWRVKLEGRVHVASEIGEWKEREKVMGDGKVQWRKVDMILWMKRFGG